MQCKGCNKNLSTQKSRFDWLVARGYSTKDAAANVLHDPMRMGPTKQCCIVNLETNYDSFEKMHEREVTKAIIKADIDEVKIINAYRMAVNQPPIASIEDMYGQNEYDRTQRLDNAYFDALRQANATNNMEIIRKVEFIRANPDLVANPRASVKLYSTDPNGTIVGEFIVKDASFDDPRLLAPSPADKFSGASTGFILDNVAKIPIRVSAAENWGAVQPVALWFGNIKLIPVYKDSNGSFQPGIIMAMTPQTQMTGQHIVLTETSFEVQDILGAEVVEYLIGTVTHPTQGQVPTHVVHLLLPSALP